MGVWMLNRALGTGSRLTAVLCVGQPPPDYASLQCSKEWRTKKLITSQEEDKRV